MSNEEIEKRFEFDLNTVFDLYENKAYFGTYNEEEFKKFMCLLCEIGYQRFDSTPNPWHPSNGVVSIIDTKYKLYVNLHPTHISLQSKKLNKIPEYIREYEVTWI